MALRPRSALRDYQALASDIVVERVPSLGGQAILMKPGLGKTPSALDAIDRLRLEMGLRRILVCVPAAVAEARVWSREAMSWEHLTHLYVTEIIGSPQEREMLLMLGSDIEVISYENLIWLTDLVERTRYQAVIYDELQMLKHPGTKRFKRMRHWAAKYPVKLGLTGSPLGNHWADIWGEIHMISADKNPLGDTKGSFLSTYFNATVQGDHQIRYDIRPDGSADVIRQVIRPWSFSLKPRAALDQIPKVIPVTIPLELPDAVRKKEAQLRCELEVELDSGTTLTALNHSKLGQAIRQFASGAVYTGETGDSSKWEELHDVKMKALEHIVDELQGQPVMVVVGFRHEIARIQKRFPKFEVMTGNIDMVDRWNRRQIPGLLIHPKGGGKGLNLQYGSSSLFFFTTPWSREEFDQTCGRVARIGQPDEYVTAHIPLAGAIDRRVWKRVTEKGEDEATLMDGVAMEVVP